MRTIDELHLAMLEGRIKEAVSMIPSLSTKQVREEALAEAASSGCFEVCEALLESGCNPNEGDMDELPLSNSINFGFPEICKLLLSNGANPNLDRTLVYAIKSDEPQNATVIARYLVEHGVDINRTFAMFGDESKRRTALDFASEGTEVFKYLRSIGAKTAAELSNQ